MRVAVRRPRRGSVLPLLGVCLIGLFAFAALAIDLGMLAVSRTQAQNAADVSALAATRKLNNAPGSVNNNLTNAVATAKTVATSNWDRSVNFQNTDIAEIDVGQYLYDTTSQKFAVTTWTNVTNDQSATPSNGSWTAMQVTISTTEPTFFARVLGINTMPSGARAVAVYRPRDVAFVLDMTGSMAYSSSFNTGGTIQNSTLRNQSLNPDNLYPTFGHYVATNNFLYCSSNQLLSTNESYPRNNYCIATPAGTAIIRNFYFDPVNIPNPTIAASPITSSTNTLINAFHRWGPTVSGPSTTWGPPESGGDSTNYVPPVYDFTGYNAFHKGNENPSSGPTPAPDSFKTMTDSTTPAITYVGDRWRRADGSINKTDTTWSGASNRPAYHAADLLGYTTANPPTAGAVPAFQTNWTDFRDPVWETYGYDLDVVQYRTQRGATNAPMNPTVYLGNNGNDTNKILLPTGDRFVGYSMGPGYWGKTFYIWPPDPRAPVGNPGDTGYVAGDWRLRFFQNASGGTFDPQVDNNTANGSGSGFFDSVDKVLLRNGSGLTVSAYGTTSSPNWKINYPAVLKWIKSGPMVLPPNLRAGRVVYYTSIPDDVDTTTGDANQKLDKVFWKNYIDFTIGWNYTATNLLYGTGDSWSAAPAAISGLDMASYKFSWEASGKRPYMMYTDSPSRPRLHFWFGPLSMVEFIADVNRPDANGVGVNWNPGTCYEAHSWQLKAGMSSVIDDVRTNRPNDLVGMVMFAAPQHNGIRVPMGQNYIRLKDALFYPKNLFPADGSAVGVTTEERPYDINFGSVAADDIPNAGGSTDPDTGLAHAFNLLSPSTSLPAATYRPSGSTWGGQAGARRGAAKLVVFETDGVPNTYRNLTFNQQGYNSYYTVGSSSGNIGNNNSSTLTPAYGVVQQMVKPMATTTTGDSGLGLPNAPCLVFPIAFGDLFDTTAQAKTDALAFLANVAYYGGTGPSGATTLPPDQIISGPYLQRIANMRDCLQTIFKSGIAVSLIE
jgi:hypothetical protein